MMPGFRYYKNLIVVLVLFWSAQVFSQQINNADSLAGNNIQNAILKPSFHYSVGSTFIVVPHSGSMAGFTISPYLSVPLSPKLSVEGGVIAGRYYSGLSGFYPEGSVNGAFNELSLFGSASYHINSQLTLYGAGIKRLAGNSPFNLLPKSSYTIGSTYNFGDFSIGVSLHMSRWTNSFSPMPFNGSQGFPFGQKPGSTLFGQ